MTLYEAIEKASHKFPSEAEDVFFEFLVSNGAEFIEAVSEANYEPIRQALVDKDDTLLGMDIRQAVERYAVELCNKYTPQVYQDFDDGEDKRLDNPQHGQAADINRRYGS